MFKKIFRYIILTLVVAAGLFININVDKQLETNAPSSKTVVLSLNETQQFSHGTNNYFLVPIENQKQALTTNSSNASLTSSKFSFDLNSKVEASAWNKNRDRVIDRAARRTESKIRNRVNREIDKIIDLTDPNSRAYREYTMKQLFNRLPYGETKIIITGAKASTLRSIVNKSRNAAIVANVYKIGRSGGRGPLCGFVIYKSANPEDDLYIED